MKYFLNVKKHHSGKMGTTQVKIQKTKHKNLYEKIAK